MKFKMVEKGYEYRTADDSISIRKSWRRVCTVETAHHCCDAYRDQSVWTVFGLDGGIQSFHLLKDAKAFVEKTLADELGELMREVSLCDDSEESQRKKSRIRHIRAILGTVCEPRKNYRQPVVKNR